MRLPIVILNLVQDLARNRASQILNQVQDDDIWRICLGAKS